MSFVDPEAWGSNPHREALLQSKKTCPECGRVFDLLRPTEMDEFMHGHDCEG